MIQTSNRFFAAALAAASVTAALFWVMTAMIRVPDTQVYPDEAIKVVMNVRVEPEERPVEPKRPQLTRKPVTDPEPLPPITKGNAGPGMLRVGHTAPRTIPGEGLGPVTWASPDGDAVPLVRVPPQYPVRALARGIEGRVVVEFTINRVGTVEDARIIAFEPTTVFNEAALEAVKQWRYEPKRVDGKAVAQRGRQIIIPFLKGDHRE